MYHPLHIHVWANFQLTAISNFHCAESLRVFFHCCSSHLTNLEVELSIDRIKNFMAIAGSQKVSEQSTYMKQFLASLLIHIYTTTRLKVGFIKLTLRWTRPGQRGLKGCACCQATIDLNSL